MTHPSLEQEKSLPPASREIRGAALVAHIDAQLALIEPQNPRKESLPAPR